MKRLCFIFILAALSAAAETLRGAFPLLVTPWTSDAKLDILVLLREADYANNSGVGGIIWPTAGEVLNNLTDDEYSAGVEALVKHAAAKKFTARLTFICPGATSADALRRMQLVNAMQSKYGLRLAILARPPDDATTEEAIVAHYRAAAAIANCPIIVQTYNGKSPQQSVASIIALAREFPDVYGHVKEESPGNKVNERIAALTAAAPVIRTVFSGWGGKGWLYQARRLGTGGVITQRVGYSPILSSIQRATESCSASAQVAAFSDYLLMLNLGDTFVSSADEMRGPHLYVLQQLGIFTNRLTRVKDKNGKFSVFSYDLPPSAVEEIAERTAVLRKYIK